MATQNIKINPLFGAGKMTISGLNNVIGFMGTPPSTIEQLAEIVLNFSKDLVFNEYQYASIDQFELMSTVAGTLNAISANSWCDLCCSKTIITYDKLKCKLKTVGYLTPNEQFVLDVLLGMPCDPNTPPANARVGIKSLETNMIISDELSESEKLPILALLAVGNSTAEYWWTEVNSGTSAWDSYFDGDPNTDFRSFWLASLMGSIMSLLYVRNSGLPLGNNSRSAYYSIVGGIIGASAFAVYK